MGGKTTMEKRGHHICRMVNYEVRQRVTQPTSRKLQGKVVTTPGNTEVMIYKNKEKLEGGMTSVEKAAQKIYDILKKEGNEYNVSKRNIRKYKLV
tara:strand:+ start:522 stop:806 length:285 start_codon:yes stop_codon:yes gene_type:complete